MLKKELGLSLIPFINFVFIKHVPHVLEVTNHTQLCLEHGTVRFAWYKQPSAHPRSNQPLHSVLITVLIRLG